MSADSASPSPQPIRADQTRPARRRPVVRLSWAAGLAAVALAVPAAGTDPTDYIAYVSAAGGEEVVEIDVATHTILKTFSADSTEGVATTPTNSRVFIAETGQYHVIAANPATGAETPIYVGPYPQDVAVSPDVSKVYATVTGGDTGAGGSDAVAVISTATDKVTGDIKVGPGRGKWSSARTAAAPTSPRRRASR